MFYRKKPVTVEAWQLTAENASEIAALITEKTSIRYNNGNVSCMYLPTLEGEMKASLGDYIIKGVNGEFYPCKPDIFEKTYEPVSEEN